MNYKPGEIKQSIIKTLREHGHKITPQRMEIITIIARDRTHPSAMNVYNKVRQKSPTISLSTVYLTLGLLKKLRLVKELEFNELDNRYDGNTDHHINLICITCGKIEDYESNLPVSTGTVKKKTGFMAHDTRLEYYGYCRKCSGRQHK